MFISMNRVKIFKGKEQTFEDNFEEKFVQRESYLRGVPGFLEFHLLRMCESDSSDDHTLYISHTIWASEKSMEDWARSESFHRDHAPKDRSIYVGPSSNEGFNVLRTAKGRE